MIQSKWNSRIDTLCRRCLFFVIYFFSLLYSVYLVPSLQYMKIIASHVLMTTFVFIFFLNDKWIGLVLMMASIYTILLIACVLQRCEHDLKRRWRMETIKGHIDNDDKQNATSNLVCAPDDRWSDSVAKPNNIKSNSL